MKSFSVWLFLVGCLLVPNLICAHDTAKSDKLLSSALTKRLSDENVILAAVKSLVELVSNGFKTGLDASMRSLFKKPVTTAVYALSMLVGVVAMLAFYESPISPLPVPPLPDPPVGRFPPENPVWPPRGQVYNNQRQAGPMMTQASQFVPHMIAPPSAPQYYPHYSNDFVHRSDKYPANQPSQRIEALRLQPNSFATLTDNQSNETSYNNYISKLTTTLDLNNVVNKKQQVSSPVSELSNKVIDYNAKLKNVNINNNQSDS